MCELLVGLPDVIVLGVDDTGGGPLRVHVETRGERPVCGGCGSRVTIRDRPVVELVDLPCFGRSSQLMWPKRRWSYRTPSCATGSWTELAVAFVDRLGHDLQDETCPIEARSMGRTLLRWRDQIAAWHRAHVTNGPTEAANNLIKRIKRVAFGFTRFCNYRIRVLLYAGRPNQDLLATITPR